MSLKPSVRKRMREIAHRLEVNADREPLERTAAKNQMLLDAKWLRKKADE
jgi:hypothetical protein